jgi:uncharacterized DUF497 family protein
MHMKKIDKKKIGFVWVNTRGQDEGNIEHIARHGLTPEDVEHAFRNAITIDSVSKTSGLPMAVGPTPTGRIIRIAYARIDENYIRIITAY